MLTDTHMDIHSLTLMVRDVLVVSVHLLLLIKAFPIRASTSQIFSWPRYLYSTSYMWGVLITLRVIKVFLILFLIAIFKKYKSAFSFALGMVKCRRGSPLTAWLFHCGRKAHSKHIFKAKQPVHNLTFCAESTTQMKIQKVLWEACLAHSVGRVPGYMLDDLKNAGLANLGAVAHSDHSATLLCKMVM